MRLVSERVYTWAEHMRMHHLVCPCVNITTMHSYHATSHYSYTLSHSLLQGTAIVAHKLVSAGVFDEAGITAHLLAPGTLGIPGCVGSRNLADCLSDLRAQVAANTKGIGLVKELIAEQPSGPSGGIRRVHGYMTHIATNAEHAVRALLCNFSLARGLPVVGSVHARDYMDDGTPIELTVTIDRNSRSAVFDFTGTGPQVYANTNAPRAVTYSAIIYCLRCLVGSDVPLNQGVLGPVRIVIPEGSLLHPSPEAAVVGGNVLTSQRVVDVVLRAFQACAASQGCMNNLTFGSSAPGSAFYETICGGAGAGPDWHGRSGVHTHMTVSVYVCSAVVLVGVCVHAHVQNRQFIFVKFPLNILFKLRSVLVAEHSHH